MTFPQVIALVDEMVTVDEEDLSRALLILPRAGEAAWSNRPARSAVAALLEHPRRFETPAVAVLSGGNIDPLVLVRVIGTAWPWPAATSVRVRDRATGRARWPRC